MRHSVVRFDPPAFLAFRRSVGTQKLFAQRLSESPRAGRSYTKQAIQMYETGRASPSLTFLHQVAEVFGADLRQFFGPGKSTRVVHTSRRQRVQGAA